MFIFIIVDGIEQLIDDHDSFLNLISAVSVRTPNKQTRGTHIFTSIASDNNVRLIVIAWLGLVGRAVAPSFQVLEKHKIAQHDGVTGQGYVVQGKR